MITNTQYALLVGIPTAAIILSICIKTYMHHRFLRVLNSNFNRLSKSMEAGIARQEEALRNRN